MKVMLFFPPHWTPAMPQLGVPTLTAHLRAHHVEVIQRDLNIEVFDAILTPGYLQQAIARLRQEYGPHAQRRPDRPVVPPREQVQWALEHGPNLANQVENAVNIIRSEAFLDGPIGVQAFLIVAQCLDLALLPFYPTSLNLSNFTPPYPVDKSRNLLRAVRDPQYNPFLDLFRGMVIPDIEREQPDLVGISIPSLDQMLAGVTLAHLIKQAGLPCHVTTGGPHITMLREAIPQVPAFFEWFDSAVTFEGETPLLRLVEALESNGDLSPVPNLIYEDGDQVRVTAPTEPEKSFDLALPDFDGLPLDRYLAPKLVLPLRTARGCYYGKCAFCNVDYAGPPSYRQLQAQRVVDQMTALHKKYGVRHIFFADEAITPRNLRDMSSLLAPQDPPIYWCGCVRFEKPLTQNILDALAPAGCCMLLFGLETASEPMMEAMAKGTQLEHMSRILRQSAAAGIWNHTFFFFGFPGETIEHAQETVNFIYQHKHFIHSASPGAFALERYSPAHRFPRSFGIKRVIEDPARDLAIYFDYEVERGMDEAMAELLASRFVDTLPEKRYGHFYITDAYRFIYASHLREMSVPHPPWVVPEEETSAVS
ncbi:MAG: radical SAM protein [Anaerolineae bacterium]|nr:radical SAM protein [Anaerolineae bacterium]